MTDPRMTEFDRRLDSFSKAVEAASWKGAQLKEDHAAIEEEYVYALMDVRAFVMNLLEAEDD